MIDGWIDSERLVIDIAYQFYFQIFAADNCKI